jgi:hypothetical protein
LKNAIKESPGKSYPTIDVPYIGFNFPEFSVKTNVDTATIVMNIVGKQAPSILKELTITILLIDSLITKPYVLPKMKLFFPGTRIEKNFSWSLELDPKVPKGHNIDEVFLLLEGSYTDISGKNKYSVNQLAGGFIFRTHPTINIRPEFEHTVRKIIKNKSIK